jgi:hypothetical protein
MNNTKEGSTVPRLKVTKNARTVPLISIQKTT